MTVGPRDKMKKHNPGHPKSLRLTLQAALYRLQGVKTYGLVGKSGTGKSFRARLVAEKHGIEILVDDGLVIRDNTILAGHWAKKEQTPLAAVKRALFADPRHAAEARISLRAARFRKVLIIATSREMTDRIAGNLGLPRTSKIFTVEGIAGPAEIQKAERRRKGSGSHAIPLPAVDIARGPLEGLAKRLSAAASAGLRLMGPRRNSEPPLSITRNAHKGEVLFSMDAVKQMILHCVSEYDSRIIADRDKIEVSKKGPLYRVRVSVRIPLDGMPAGRLHELREYILHGLERHAGLLVKDVTVVVKGVGSA